MSETTAVDIGFNEIMHVCDNCGAQASSPNSIGHYATCKSGESKRWEKYYNKANEEEERLARAVNDFRE